jgi:hypothetical protein
MVVTEISAFDTKGKFVADLQPEELRVLDEGGRQGIAFFRRGSTIPHAIALLIDRFNIDRTQKTSEWERTLRAFSRAESAWDAFL